ncbi:MAG TPA: hypothetical protein VNS46_15150 [Nocardioides sp.]|nr:hypothetical protein [Nocardioides sp.]
MPMMNSDARKRALEQAVTPTSAADPRLTAALLADAWDSEADREDASGNGFAAVILHQHARELRAAMRLPLSA